MLRDLAQRFPLWYLNPVKPAKGRSRRHRSNARPWRTGVVHLRIKAASPLDLGHVPLRADLKHLIELLGNNQTAELLGVAKSQTSRWLRGEPIGAESARRISDLEYVLRRALEVFQPDAAAEFLTFPQPFLNGARPIDVLLTRGIGPVVAALNQVDEGAYV